MPSLNINESGQVVRVNLQEVITGADTLKFILEPQLGEKLEKSASDGVVIGTVNVTVDDETYLANQYLEYTISQNDLKYAGSWRLKGEAIFNDPDGVGVQQLADPDFEIANSTSDGTGSDWSWTSSEWNIGAGSLRTTTFAAIVKTRLTYKERSNLQVEWTTSAALGDMFLGSHQFTLDAGSHSEVIVVPLTPGDLTIVSGGSIPNISNFEITPLASSAKIVSDYKRIEVLA